MMIEILNIIKTIIKIGASEIESSMLKPEKNLVI